jgi:hypothetical protein
MTLKGAILGLALTTVAMGASAAVVTDWGTLGPVPSAAVRLDPPGPIDDIYTFLLAAESDVPTYAIKFLGEDTNIDNAMVSLFSGTTAASTLVGAFAFDEVQPGTTVTFTDLMSGAYYLEITGTAMNLGGAYDVNASAQAPSPPLDAPEPANAALLLAGLGLLGVATARRRSR